MQVRRLKPCPDIYVRAAEKLNVEPANCILFEDPSAGVVRVKDYSA
jgi:HAD superfamily hydrolase (TIGR01509 family)